MRKGGAELTVPPNNALHLQTTPVIILASARMPPYAGFQVSLDVRCHLRPYWILAVALALPGCAICQNSNYCELSDLEDSQLRKNVRAFLIGERGKDFVFYDTETSLFSVVEENRGSCGILIMPMRESEDGGTLLHGEGIVRFDRGTLIPTEIGYVQH